MHRSLRLRLVVLSATLLTAAAHRAPAQTVVVPPFLVSATSANRYLGDLDVAPAPDGSFTVIWSEYTPQNYTGRSDFAFIRRFSALGVPLGPSVRVDTTGHVHRPVIQPDGQGGYVAAWQWVKKHIPADENHQQYAFFGRRFDGIGTGVGPDFQVSLNLPNTTVSSGSVAGLPSGAAFVWEENGVWIRLLDANGDRRGGDVRISDLGGVNDVATLSDGGFVVTWTDRFGYPRMTWVRAFGPDGQARGEAIPFPQADASEPWYPPTTRVAANPLGGFAIVGTHADFAAQHNEVWVRRFTDSGDPVDAPFLVHVDPNYTAVNPDLEFDTSGKLYAAYAEFITAFSFHIVAQGVSSSGDAAGPAVEIAPEVRGSTYVRTARLQNGNFVNVWRAIAPPSPLGSVFANVVALCGQGLTACGDGVRQAGCEECDDGAGNSDTAPDACRTDCRLPRCGDGVQDGGEQCDDGNNQSCDGCSATCRIEVGFICGDGIRQPACGEECDQGAANSDVTPDACRTNCLLPRCGDSVQDAAEQCDDGNNHNCDGCDFQCQAEPAPPTIDTICDPLPYASATSAQVTRFDTGHTHFVRADNVATGLGPVFNGTSCAECHNQPTIGGSSTHFVTRIGRTGANGFDPLVELGGSVLQAHGITTDTCSVPGEVVPPEATFVGHRDTPPLFGLGLVDSIPDAQILRYADPTDRNHDGIRGRANVINGRLGRFGWKAQVAALLDFSALAYRNELGVTNPIFPAENNPQGGPVVCDDVPDPEDDGSTVAAFTDFTRLLAPLPRPTVSLSAKKGLGIFRRLTCSKCHLDSLKADAAPVPALRGKAVPLYSDLLLHDMGPDLADGIVEGQASGSDFRTAPLWGVRYSAPYLHDGRAATLAEAIAAHGGEAQRARALFLALPDASRADLIAFLNSL